MSIPHTRTNRTTHRRVHEPRSLPLALVPTALHKRLDLLPVPLHRALLLLRPARRAHELVHRDAPVRERGQARGERARGGRGRVRAGEAPQPVLVQARGDRRRGGRGQVWREDGHARPDEAVLYVWGDCAFVVRSVGGRGYGVLGGVRTGVGPVVHCNAEQLGGYVRPKVAWGVGRERGELPGDFGV